MYEYVLIVSDQIILILVSVLPECVISEDIVFQ